MEQRDPYMELINQTTVTAKLLVSSLDGGPDRFGILVAKATFSMVGSGQPGLVTQDPFPIFEKDEPMETGLEISPPALGGELALGR
jgi:hypothetical protein